MRHPEFPVVSFLTVPLLLCSLPSHFRARSVCTMALIAWLTILNIVRGVNSLVWANNVAIRLEVWCDITTKLLIGFTYAVPLSALCICRHLEHIASNRQAITTITDKHRRMKVEGLLCFGVPMIFMALHYVVQGHRYDLFEDAGCYPNTYSSVPGITVVWIPPLAISLVTLTYASAAFFHFLRRRIEFAAILQKSNSSMSPGRYFRLMAFAVVEVIWDSGINSYILWFNIKFSGLRPWISWNNVHSNFSRVATFPNAFTPSFLLTQLIWQWWIVPISSVLVFFFFSFGSEAMSDYRLVFQWVQRNVLRRGIKRPPAYSLPSSLPTYIPRLPFSSDTHFAVSPKAEDTFKHDLNGLSDLMHKGSNLEDRHSRHHYSLSLIPDHCLPTAVGDPQFLSQMSSSMNTTTSLLSHLSDSSGTSFGRHSKDVSGPSSGLVLLPPSPSPALSTMHDCYPSDESYLTALHSGGEHASSTSPLAPGLPRVPSPTIHSPMINPYSTTHDSGITVSSAYMPDERMATRPRDGAPFTSMTSDTPSSHSVPYIHPLGGVHVTVERHDA